MNDTLKLTDDQVLTEVREVLREHLPLTADGTCCTTDDLLNVLLGVAVNRCGTLEAVCTDWTSAPDPETVLRYLNEQLCVEDLPELEERLNAALRAAIPRRVWRQAREVAIDFHDRPSYGKQSLCEGLGVRSKARDGTTRFYRIATAYVILNGLRVTLALRFVLPDREVVSLLDDLLKSLKKQGFQMSRHIDYIYFIPILFVTIIGTFHMHFDLLAGDWDFWIDWKDRQWWPIVTPITAITFCAALQYYNWVNYRQPFGATICILALLAGKYVTIWASWWWWSNYPVNFVMAVHASAQRDRTRCRAVADQKLDHYGRDRRVAVCRAVLSDQLGDLRL